MNVFEWAGAECAHVFRAEAWQGLKTLGYLKNALGALQVDGDQLGDAALGHGDAEQAVHAGHGDRVVGDHHEARLGSGRHVVQKV